MLKKKTPGKPDAILLLLTAGMQLGPGALRLPKDMSWMRLEARKMRWASLFTGLGFLLTSTFGMALGVAWVAGSGYRSHRLMGLLDNPRWLFTVGLDLWLVAFGLLTFFAIGVFLFVRGVRRPRLKTP